MRQHNNSIYGISIPFSMLTNSIYGYIIKLKIPNMEMEAVQMKKIYPLMEATIVMRGIRKSVIAARLGISERCLYNKLKGITPFTWKEVEILQKDFFPDMTKEEIMNKSAETNPFLCREMV